MEMTPQKTILVLRHAKSDWGAGLPDYHRPLNERGRQGAKTMGEKLAAYDIDLAWCSGAARTVETWELAQKAGAGATRTDTRQGFYDTWARDLMEEMVLLDETVSTLLIVNHQPTVSVLVALLAGPSPLVSQATSHYPTAGLAVLTHDGPWSSLVPGAAVLRSFESPQAG